MSQAISGGSGGGGIDLKQLYAAWKEKTQGGADAQGAAGGGPGGTVPGQPEGAGLPGASAAGGQRPVGAGEGPAAIPCLSPEATDLMGGGGATESGGASGGLPGAQQVQGVGQVQRAAGGELPGSQQVRAAGGSGGAEGAGSHTGSNDEFAQFIAQLQKNFQTQGAAA